ncbi:hypothetical protein ACIBJC_11025 [Streptomyces sp. NPDC050509]|uniref:hypothetical protein n=1 Tax=Streptomyces sp. NPDC050509 TaxID=3365620 RepID=UPI0037B7235E
MQDRRRRTALHLPPPSGPVLLPRERQSSSTGPSPGSQEPEGSSGTSGTNGAPGTSGAGGSSDDNPFAPPPEGRPDQPWQPRRPEDGDGQQDGQDGGSGRGGWGSQWSSRQPGRSSGGFGSRPGGQGNGQNGPNGAANGQDGSETGRGSGPRWDPTDPAQRRARYALLGGMWAFFFALFDLPDIALLLGALSVYWGASALRAKARKPSDGTSASALGAGQPAPAGAPDQAGQPAPSGQIATRSLTTAAVSGLVAAGLALAIVATTFTVQLVYRDYYTCVNDALTKTGQLSCNDLLPRSLEPVFGVKE